MAMHDLTAEEIKLVKAWRRLGVGTAGRYLLLRFPDDAFKLLREKSGECRNYFSYRAPERHAEKAKS